MTTLGTFIDFRKVPKSPSWFQVPVSRTQTASASRYSSPGGANGLTRRVGSRKS